MEKNTSTKRPPVVVVMGHVDHGKTTLLDYIRKSTIAAREAGGITQSIGAYEITHPSAGSGQVHKITFIDTPGHEAFSRMRSRCAQAADLAILVVAVDDGVQPQTKEVIATIQAAEIPYVVALNKVDKEGVDINKVKNELTAAGVLLEGYGGSVSFQPVSAKTGEGVNELLDLLILAADLGEHTAHLEALGSGVILESRLDNRRGILASGIIKEGTVRTGHYVRAGNAIGKIKGLEDFMGKRITEAVPSAPVLIFGFESLPKVGDAFETSENPFPAPSVSGKNEKATTRAMGTKEGATVRLMLKADVSGSLEALEQIVASLPKPEAVEVKVMDASVGDISDGDINFAASYGALVIGFKAKVTKAASTLAEAHQVRIVTSDIVYDLVKTLEDEFRRLDKTVIKGDLEILAVFGKKGGKDQIVGGKVVMGALENQASVGIERKGAYLGVGKIVNLQSQKKNVISLATGLEGGLLVDSEMVIKVGDHLIVR
jgi:translation initiation factor IF-2